MLVHRCQQDQKFLFGLADIFGEMGKVFVVLCPPANVFIAFLYTIFRKFSCFAVSILQSYVRPLFAKIARNFQKIRTFINFFKIEKTIVIVSKSLLNYYVCQNSDKFSHNTAKSSNFNLDLSKVFGDLDAENLLFHISKDPSFLQLASPLLR